MAYVLTQQLQSGMSGKGIANSSDIDDATLGKNQQYLNNLFNQGKGLNEEGLEVPIGKSYTGGSGIAVDANGKINVATVPAKPTNLTDYTAGNVIIVQGTESDDGVYVVQGEDDSKYLYLFVRSNNDKSKEYSKITINSFAYSDNISGDGGSVTPILGYMQTDDDGVTYTSGAALAYSIEGDGFSIDTETGEVSAEAYNDGRSSTVTVVVALHGKIKIATATVKQEPSSTKLYTILCSDGTKVTPTVNETDGTVVSTNVPSGKTPIGVCVIPSDHMSDGKARFMSLKGMTFTSPESGGSNAYMCWGGLGVNLPLTNHQETNLSCGTQWPINLLTNQCSDGYYRGDMNNAIPFPYNSDGSANSEYRGSTMRTCDMDGKGNTDVIIANVTASWQSGDIINSFDNGNYPAACACRRYAPSTVSGLGAGNWYLPSIGELGYAIAKLKLINNLITALSGVAIASYWYWSSSECDSGNALYLYFGNGGCNNYRKNNDSSVRAFLAF